MRVMKWLTIVLLCLIPPVLLSAQAQVPRSRKMVGSGNLYEIRRWIAKASFSRVVTVDADGNGDYTTLGAALSYVSSRTDRNGFTRYLVLVYPGTGDGTSAVTSGNFSEVSINIPAYTVIQGVASPRDPGNSYDGLPVINLTGTSGALLTLNHQSALANLVFKVPATALTGATSVLTVPGPTAFVDNVGIKALSVSDDHPLDLVLVSGGSLAAWDMTTWRSGTATQTRNLITTGVGNVSLYGGRHIAGTSQPKLFENASTGTMKLYGVRLDPGAMATLTATSGTIETHLGTEYDSKAGTITDPQVRAGSLNLNNACKVLSGSGSPEGSVTGDPCWLYLRTDGSASTTLYVKESGTGTNTGWIAK